MLVSIIKLVNKKTVPIFFIVKMVEHIGLFVQ